MTEQLQEKLDPLEREALRRLDQLGEQVWPDVPPSLQLLEWAMENLPLNQGNERAADVPDLLPQVRELDKENPAGLRKLLLDEGQKPAALAKELSELPDARDAALRLLEHLLANLEQG